jgi:AcrR family transcriptional regulator
VSTKLRSYTLHALYALGVPRLWTETIEAHRSTVRDAILDTAAALAAEHGVSAVTMTEIAERAGIGRRTLYKYFPDVEAILVAWHQRHVARHLTEITEAAAQPGTPGQRLDAVLEAFALRIFQRRPHDTELAALVHRGEHMAAPQRQLREFLADLIADAAAGGEARGDAPPGELASYCMHALTAASGLPSEDAVRRLVAFTLAGLRPPR